MKFKSVIWPRVAFVLSAGNFVAAGFAAAAAEPWHATAHVAVAFGFGWWAQHLRQRRRDDELKTEIQDTFQSPLERLQVLEGEVARLQHELNEVQERLDFAERLLVQGRESRQG
jgi:hypothetical protein